MKKSSLRLALLVGALVTAACWHPLHAAQRRAVAQPATSSEPWLPHPGGVSIDFATAKPVQEHDDIFVRLHPIGFLDNTYHLASGDPSILTFVFKNVGKRPVTAPCLLLELPVGIELLDAASGATIIERAPMEGPGGRGTRYTIDIRKGAKIGSTDFSAWNSLACLVRSNLADNDRDYACSYSYRDGNYETDSTPFTIRITPPIKARRPHLFSVGFLWSQEGNFQDEQAARELAAFYARCGCSVSVGPNNAFSRELGKLGLRRLTSAYPLSNGYTMGRRKKPAYAAFRDAEGNAVGNGVCPVEVYARGEYFRADIEAHFRQILVTERSAEDICSNWEPHEYALKGCFCERCKSEFRKFSRIDGRTLDRLWPGRIAWSRYRDTWLTFRSWQHARLVETLEHTVHALGKEAGIESHFIPQIHWGLLTDFEKSDMHPHEKLNFRQYDGLAFADKIPEIVAWGPYCFWPFKQPYRPATGYHIGVYAAAKQVNASLATRIRRPRDRPRLYAFPHGFQLKDWVTEPEALTFEILSYFVNRWNGAWPYRFPKGYDARYWRAVANANEIMAELEPIVLNGTPARNHTVEPVTPLPALRLTTRREYVLDRIPGVARNAILQHDEFRKGNQRLFSVGNFWEKGESFFLLKVHGLHRKRHYVLRDPVTGRCYGGALNSPALAGHELDKGVLLHVGALRFAFFLLEPYEPGRTYGPVTTVAQMKAARAARRSAIGAEFEREQQHAASTYMKTGPGWHRDQWAEFLAKQQAGGALETQPLWDEQFSQWTSLAHEGKVRSALKHARSGKAALRYELRVDHERDGGGADSSRHVGWPALKAELTPGTLNAAACDFLTLWSMADFVPGQTKAGYPHVALYVHPDSGGTPIAVSLLRDAKPGTWIPTVVALASHTGENRAAWSNVTSFRITTPESRYVHGANITLIIDDIAAIRAKNPILADVKVFPGQQVRLPVRRLLVGCHVIGAHRAEPNRYPVSATLVAPNGQTVATQSVDLAALAPIPLDTSTLRPGTYRLTLQVGAPACSTATEKISLLPPIR